MGYPLKTKHIIKRKTPATSGRERGGGQGKQGIKNLQRDEQENEITLSPEIFP